MLGSPKRSAVFSVTIHGLAILLILLVAGSKRSVLTELMPVRETPVYLPKLVRAPGMAGGGGQRSLLPPSKGQPPKAAPRVFVPPLIRVQETRPMIEMPPVLLSAVDVQITTLQLPMGIPNGVSGPTSGGPGGPAGFGRGKGPGLGDNDGPGRGDGPDGDGAGGVRGKVTSLPVLVSQIEPEYSEEARKAKFQGTVTLSIVVGTDGRVSDVRVVRGLGLGLDERAIEAVRKWAFRAGTVDGKAVPMRALVEVNFRLL